MALEGQITQLETRLHDKQRERGALQQQLEKAQAGKEDSVSRWLGWLGRRAVRHHGWLLLQPSCTRCAARSTSVPARLARCTAQEERRVLQQRKTALEAAVSAQAAELADYAGNDPERYDRLSEGPGVPACQQSKLGAVSS